MGPGPVSVLRCEMTCICWIKEIISCEKCWWSWQWKKPFPLAAFLSSTLFVREARWSRRAWKTNVPQDSSDNLIYIIAQKHLRKKDWLSARSSTCHCCERVGFDVQWVKQTIWRHADVVIREHVPTTKVGSVNLITLLKEKRRIPSCVSSVCALIWLLWCSPQIAYLILAPWPMCTYVKEQCN